MPASLLHRSASSSLPSVQLCNISAFQTSRKQERLCTAFWLAYRGSGLQAHLWPIVHASNICCHNSENDLCCRTRWRLQSSTSALTWARASPTRPASALLRLEMPAASPCPAMPPSTSWPTVSPVSCRWKRGWLGAQRTKAAAAVSTCIVRPAHKAFHSPGPAAVASGACQQGEQGSGKCSCTSSSLGTTSPLPQYQSQVATPGPIQSWPATCPD